MAKEALDSTTVQDVIDAKGVAEIKISKILQEFRNDFGFDVSSVNLYKWGRENCVDIGITLPEKGLDGLSANRVIVMRQATEAEIEAVIDDLENKLSILVDKICLRTYPAPVITLQIKLPSKPIIGKSRKNNFFQIFLNWF
jgi:hypothetical protein